MKPHPRIRKTIKWGGAAVTVLLVVVWIGSGWFVLGWVSPDGRARGVRAGRYFLGGPVAGAPHHYGSGPSRGWLPFRFEWWFSFKQDSMMFEQSSPLWIPALGAAMVTAAAWRFDALARRRARMGFCPKCHYDRTGLAASAKCPECGAASG